MAEDTKDAEVVVSKRDGSPRYIDHLTPPTGTSFWSVQDITIFNNQRVQNENGSHYVTLTWRCQCYIYTTGARPDSSNFAGSGGAFYVVMRHSGQITSTLYPGWQNFKLQISTGSGTPEVHLPGYSVKEGDNWTSTIDYEQAMQMFRNNGNETFTNIAKYNETYQLYKMNQSGGIVNGQIEAVFKPDEASRWDNPRQLRGLSVFRQTQPNSWPVTFTFRALGLFDNYTRTQTTTRAISLNFQ